MRKALLIAMLVASAATMIPVNEAQSQEAPFCFPRRGGCVPMTSASYNACYSLALSRGLNVSKGDRVNLNDFIYQCLAGRIPGAGTASARATRHRR